MKIGILSKNYAAKRLFLDKLPFAVYKDIRFYNWHLWKNVHLWFLKTIGKLKLTPEEAAARLFYDFKSMIPTGCDVFHFFNTMCHDRKQKWVISIESAVPWSLEVTRCVEASNPDMSVLRNNRYIKNAIRELAHSNCLAMVALSKCSYNIQRKLIAQFPEYSEAIDSKLITLYPPQSPLVKSVDHKGLTYSSDEQLIFVFIGRNYYRKGGRDVVEVLSKLHSKYDFKLILISALDKDEEKYERSEHDYEDAVKMIKANSSWIEYYESLPNDEVLEKIKKAHVALLPTWMDTFAYSVLECQACGTPVISSSLRALTEINGEELGWLIDVPINSLNNPILNSREDFEKFEKILQHGLQENVVHVLENRQEVRQKAERCLTTIADNYSPESYSKCLELLYQGRVNEAKRLISLSSE